MNPLLTSAANSTALDSGKFWVQKERLDLLDYAVVGSLYVEGLPALYVPLDHLHPSPRVRQEMRSSRTRSAEEALPPTYRGRIR